MLIVWVLTEFFLEIYIRLDACIDEWWCMHLLHALIASVYSKLWIKNYKINSPLHVLHRDRKWTKRLLNIWNGVHVVNQC